ncbi:hypothetical protein AU476_16895 [Cupriavidus sp. UYMSc13B]|nr:hypothetical protein AU476_16895 [Cupriavidus sp. UYMSc13B]
MDFAIKVCGLPYRVIGPTDGPCSGSQFQEGEIGICFAGSTVALFGVKETVSEVLMHLQAMEEAPVSLEAISGVLYSVYKRFVPEMTSAMMSDKGIVQIIVAGYCPASHRHRAYLLSTDLNARSSMTEILEGPNSFELLGSGVRRATEVIAGKTGLRTTDYLDTLQKVIDDETVSDVGGSIVYGHTGMKSFATYGVQDFDDEGNVRYMRGGLNFNHPEFQLGNSGGLNVTYIMLIRPGKE